MVIREMEGYDLAEGHTIIFIDEEWLIDEPVISQSGDVRAYLVHMHKESDPSKKTMFAFLPEEIIQVTKFYGVPMRPKPEV